MSFHRIFFIEYHRLFSKKKVFCYILGSFLLCLFLFFSSFKQSEEQRTRIYSNEEDLLKYHELLEREMQENPSSEVENLWKESLVQIEMLNISKKYHIVYQDDDRFPYFEQLKSVLLQLNAFEGEEDSFLLAEKEQLENYLSYSYSEIKMIEKDSYEKELEKLEQKETLSLEDEASISILKDKIEIVSYYISHPEIERESPLIATGKKMMSLLETIYFVPRSEEEFYKNDSLIQQYGDYKEYCLHIEDNRTLAKEKYDFLSQTLHSGYPLTRNELEGTFQLFTIRDGLESIYLYGSIVIVIFSLLTLFKIYQEYDYNTILQYRLHHTCFSILLGKYLAYLTLLLFFFLLGFCFIPIISYFFSSFVFSNQSFYFISSITYNDSYLVRYLLPYGLQFVIGMSCLCFLHLLSYWKLPRGVLLFFSFFLFLVLFLLPCFFYFYHFSSLIYVPFTYFYYSFFLEYGIVISSQSMLFLVFFTILIGVVLFLLQLMIMKKREILN